MKSGDMVNYRQAELREIEGIYNTYMVKDFPPLELKPLKSIEEAVKKGWYKVYLACDKNEIKGYANIAFCGEGIYFLDYFAVMENVRGTGVGTAFFNHLPSVTNAKCILLEVESVESAKNEAEAELRKRRIAFYKRSGCVDTGCVYNVFGVEYNVFINKDIPLTSDFLATVLSAYEYAYAAILRRDDKSYIKRIK